MRVLEEKSKAPMTDQTAIVVFSFNRGAFLSNAISSIEACAPDLPVIIIDDNSTDPQTRGILSDLAQTYRVINNAQSAISEHKTGGLYGAMNAAMQIAAHDGYETVIFIQDDMQFVRRVTKHDHDMYRAYFSEVPNSIQLATTFVRQLSADSFLDDRDISRRAYAYIRRPERERGKSSFSATGVFSVSRFFAMFDSFESGEGPNSRKARDLGLVCGRAIFPNMCWLPYPTSFRGKKRSLKHRIFEYFGHSGYHPIELMSAEAEAAFLARDPHIVPIMEHFLHAPDAPRQDIWSTGGGEYNFAAYGSLPAKLFKTARTIKHGLKR